jgi:hypothetical protein
VRAYKPPLHSTWPAEVARLERRLAALDALAYSREAIFNPSRQVEIKAQRSYVLKRLERIKVATIERELDEPG